MSPKENTDTCEVIEWAAKQAWCNGKVGMLGIGGRAVSHFLVAALQPPHLKAIAPLAIFWDNYRELSWPGGIFASGHLRWLTSLVNLDVHTERSEIRKELGEVGLKEAIARTLVDDDVIADPQLADALKNPDAPTNASLVDAFLHPTYSSYWKDRAVTDVAKIKVPAYLATISHRPGVLYHWSDLKIPKKMVYLPPAYVDRPFYQLSWELLRWYDYWLKGIDTGIMDEPMVRMFVQGANEWLMADDFPIPGTKCIPFNLHENGSLCEIDPLPEAASVSYDDAPNNRGSLKYCSPPMVENTEIVGTIVLNLYSSCRGTDINFFVSLWDADPEANEICLTRGWLKGSHRDLDPKRSKPWLPVHMHTNPKPLIPGQVYKFSIDLCPTANLFKEGHRIVLKISGSDDKPENLGEVKMYHLVSQTPNTITVYHNAKYPSHLLLPITKGNIIGPYISSDT